MTASYNLGSRAFAFFFQYGDSYSEDVTEEGLKEVFKKIQEQVTFTVIIAFKSFARNFKAQ